MGALNALLSTINRDEVNEEGRLLDFVRSKYKALRSENKGRFNKSKKCDFNKSKNGILLGEESSRQTST